MRSRYRLTGSDGQIRCVRVDLIIRDSANIVDLWLEPAISSQLLSVRVSYESNTVSSFGVAYCSEITSSLRL